MNAVSILFTYFFQVLSVTLGITQSAAELNPARSQANVTIILNDEAHGVIEFPQDSYTVQEKDHNTTAQIQIVRKRGTHGDVKVYYRFVLHECQGLFAWVTIFSDVPCLRSIRFYAFFYRGVGTNKLLCRGGCLNQFLV